jgi:hypothetical protein
LGAKFDLFVRQFSGGGVFQGVLSNFPFLKNGGR